MKKLVTFAMIVAMLAIVGLGCQNDSNPIDSKKTWSPPDLAAQKLTLPTGATLVMATFNIRTINASGETINVHRITADWDEMTVTWDNFAGSFDPAIIESFTASSIDWYSIDVTGLVQGWLDDDYPNYGLLLEQGQTAFTHYYSSESPFSDYHPYLEICYEIGGTQDCMVIRRDIEGMVYDAYVWELYPTQNNGSSASLLTGLVGGLEKYSLLKFDMESVPELAAIGDFVWHDMDMDGIQDEGEPGVPGVVVNLYDCEDNFIATMMTDVDGRYLFDELPAGDYYVEFILPDGYEFSPQDQGMDDAMDSDANMNGMTGCINLEAGETDLTWDAGIWRPVQKGCTLTIGYWKTHAGFGPQDDMVTQYLTIWLGTAGGGKSLAVTSAAIAVDVLKMKTYGKNNNGITKLYAQLLGAKLNIANGADYTDVEDIINAADAFLADHDYTDWKPLVRAESEYVDMVKYWHGMLDDYNNGDIGPGHCNDFDDGGFTKPGI